MPAPDYVRYGNLVTEVKNFKTIEHDSINAAKRYIRRLGLPPGGSKSIQFSSRGERRRALFRMHQQLNGRTL